MKNFAILKQLIDMANKNDGHIKIPHNYLMPLTVELLPDNQITLCHYGELNGDLMADPEVIFKYTDTDAKAVYFRNDYMGYEKWEDCTNFAEVWLQNIKDQGYVI